MAQTAAKRSHSLVSPVPTEGMRSYSGSKLRLGPARQAITDLDALPFVDRSLIDIRKYAYSIGEAMAHGVIPILATRGCPYSCTYCHRIMSKKPHYRSPQNIYDEVRYYYDLGFRRFSFVDDIFNLRRDISEGFYNLVIRNNLKIQIFFPNGLRGDILSPDHIDLMVEAGVVSFALALETASPRLQRAIKKNMNLEKLRNNIEYIVDKHHENLMLDLFIMMGFPSETEEELELTFDFVRSIEWLHFPVLSMVQIYPGSDMVEFALENGVSREMVERAPSVEYHDAPETLPWSKEFAKEKQVEFFVQYFFNRERLLSVLPVQMQHFHEDELVQKYNSVLPYRIDDFDGLLNILQLTKEDLNGVQCTTDWEVPEHGVETISSKPVAETRDDALRILLLDLSTLFRADQGAVYAVLEQPLGMLYLHSMINEKMDGRVAGKIAKSAVDFDTLEDLDALIDEFKPDVIGARTLSCYKNFFHDTLAHIKKRHPDLPIIGGGPYISSDYAWALDDSNISLGVIGEGEYAIIELLEMFLANDKQLPPADQLATIAGVAVLERE
ncbi:B12-binding domain-containing radical SAM protein [Roseivivax sp. CAU 1753]